jgi:hypothetical protein
MLVLKVMFSLSSLSAEYFTPRADIVNQIAQNIKFDM